MLTTLLTKSLDPLSRPLTLNPSRSLELLKEPLDLLRPLILQAKGAEARLRRAGGGAAALGGGEVEGVPELWGLGV